MARRTEKEFEALVQKHMATLKCTREEAVELINCDDEIDSGNKELFALTDEQKKLVRGLTKADRKPAKKGETKRERKVDEDKKTVFGWLKVTLDGFHLNGEIENLTSKNEAEISFSYKGSDYTVKLTKHRPKK